MKQAILRQDPEGLLGLPTSVRANKDQDDDDDADDDDYYYY